MDESEVSLSVDTSTLPSSTSPIACTYDNSQSGGKISFRASIANAPASKNHPLEILDYALIYDGETYSSGDLNNAFVCTPEETAGLENGNVDCEMPISVFPGCMNQNPPAAMELLLYVNGGGLSLIYGDTGKALQSQEFQVYYVPGPPNCGNGQEDEGETSDNCCKDTGCLPIGSGESAINTFCPVVPGTCSVATQSCCSEDDLHLTVTMEEDELNCMNPNVENAKFIAEVSPRPTEMVSFSGTYIEGTGTYMDGIPIDTYCKNAKAGSSTNKYVWECSIPLSLFPPCYVEDTYNVQLHTTVSYRSEIGGEENGKEVSGATSFEITDASLSPCNSDETCDSSEQIDLCCSDCGCTGESELCVWMNGPTDRDFECSDEETSLSAGSATVDCASEGKLSIEDVEIQNQPYGADIDWYVTYDDTDYSIGCSAEETLKNQYTCETLAENIPDLCMTSGDKDITFKAIMSYFDGDTQQYVEDFEKSLDMTVSQDSWQEHCGRDGCQSNMGEDETTCCLDCGCPEDDQVCVPCSGCTGDVCDACVNDNTLKCTCIDKSDITLTIPATDPPESYILPSTVNYEEAAIEGEERHFTGPMKFTAQLTNLPYGMPPADEITAYYLIGDYIEGGPPEDRYDDMEESYDIEIKDLSSNNLQVTVWLENETYNGPTDKDLVIGLSFEVEAPDGSGTVMVEDLRSNPITLSYNDNNDYLTSIEDNLKKIGKRLSRLINLLAIVGAIVGLGTGCFFSGNPDCAHQEGAKTVIAGGLLTKIGICLTLVSAVVGYMNVDDVIDVETETILYAIGGGMAVGIVIGQFKPWGAAFCKAVCSTIGVGVASVVTMLATATILSILRKIEKFKGNADTALKKGQQEVGIPIQ